MGDKLIIFGDTETTGLSEEDRIAQLAYSYKKDNRVSKEVLCNPGISMQPEATVVTGIFNKDLIDNKKLTDTEEFKELSGVIEGGGYFMAYNAGFDVDMLKREGLVIPEDKVIDLYKVARILLNDMYITNREGEEVKLSNFKLQYLRVILNMDEKDSFNKLVRDYGLEKLTAHTALSDVVVLEYLYHWIMSKFKLSFNDLLEINKMNYIEDYITFGNIFEKGTPYRTVLRSLYTQNGIVKYGYDYLDWCVENMEMRNDTLYSIKTHFYNSLIMGDIEYQERFKKYLDFGLLTEESVNKQRKANKLLEGVND